MHFIVHVLEVTEKQVGPFSNRFHNLRLRVTARIHRRMYIQGSTSIQQSQKKVRLHQRFASGERNTTAGLVVEYDIPFNFGHDLANGRFPPDDLPGTGQTDIHASAAEHTFLHVCYRTVFNKRNRLMWTRLCTLTASDTSALTKAEFDISLPAFRIMTPQALQRTTFEKHCSTDSRAIMYGVPLDIEYKSFCI